MSCHEKIPRSEILILSFYDCYLLSKEGFAEEDVELGFWKDYLAVDHSRTIPKLYVWPTAEKRGEGCLVNVCKLRT